MRPSATGHSPDRKWWHDGTIWRPAVAADGRERFDGVRWRDNRRRIDVPVLVLGVVLFVTGCLAWALLIIVMVSDPDPRRPSEPKPEISGAVFDLVPWWPRVGFLLVLVGLVLISVRPVRRIRDGEQPPA